MLDIVIGVVGALVGGFLLSFVVDTAHPVVVHLVHRDLWSGNSREH